MDKGIVLSNIGNCNHVFGKHSYVWGEQLITWIHTRK